MFDRKAWDKSSVRKSWLFNNKERLKEYHRKYHLVWYAKNKERIDLKNKNYAKTHKEQMVKNVRRYQIKYSETHKKYEKKYSGSVAGYWRRYKYSARKRNYEFEFSFQDFAALITRPCEYCGEVEKQRGIDRSDNSLGYLKENCVPCCASCNMMKKTMTKEEFLNHIKKIYDFNKSIL